MSEFMEELKKYQIRAEYDSVLRPILCGGDKTARKHYARILRENPEFEKKLLLELAEANVPFYDYLSEYMAAYDREDLEDTVEMLMRYEK